MTNSTKREYPALPVRQFGDWTADERVAIHRYADPLLDEIERLKEDENDMHKFYLSEKEKCAELRATLKRQREVMEQALAALQEGFTVKSDGKYGNAITALQAELEKKESYVWACSDCANPTGCEHDGSCRKNGLAR